MNFGASPPFEDGKKGYLAFKAASDSGRADAAVCQNPFNLV
jgi:hypothetical protein